MKIMIVKFQGRAGPYVMDDLMTFFNATGHSCAVFDLRKMSDLPQEQRNIGMINAVKNALHEFMPDAIMGYGANNVFSFKVTSGSSFDLFTYFDIPSISIFYDSPLDPRVFDHSFETYHPEYNYFFVWDKHYVDELKKIGYKKVFYMPIGTNIKRFKKLTYDADDANKFSADVSFVGSYTPKRELILRTLLDRYKLVVWGYEWEKAKDPRFKDCIRGVADNQTDLVKVYNYSKININITVDQGISSLNMRVFDCMASGGFLISDYKSDFDTLFDRENEAVTYQCADELPDLVGYYLKHEEKRIEKARLGRRRVLSDHSYQNRTEFIANTLADNGALDTPRWWEKHGDPIKAIDNLLGLKPADKKTAMPKNEHEDKDLAGIAGKEAAL